MISRCALRFLAAPPPFTSFIWLFWVRIATLNLFFLFGILLEQLPSERILGSPLASPFFVCPSFESLAFPAFWTLFSFCSLSRPCRFAESRGRRPCLGWRVPFLVQFLGAYFPAFFARCSRGDVPNLGAVSLTAPLFY